MKETFVCFIVVCFATGFVMVSGSFTVNSSKAVIMGKYGSSVVLPCWLNPEINAEDLEIRWYRPEQFSNPLLLYQSRGIRTDLQSYRNHSTLTLRNPQSKGLQQGDISLKLDNLGLSDIGNFHCYVSGDKAYGASGVELNITALGSFPLLSLEHHHDALNLSCASCGWFPQPSLLWESTNEKRLTFQRTVYSEQKNGLFCVYSWAILSSSDPASISCSVMLSEDEKRNVSLDLGARLSDDDNSGMWKILFTLALLCVLALIGISFVLYRKYKQGYKAVNHDEPKVYFKSNVVDLRKDLSDINMDDLKKSAVAITLDVDKCKKDNLKFNTQGNVVRDADGAAVKYKDQGFPYDLCVHGKNVFDTGRIYWEVQLQQENVPPKKSWLIGVAKASCSTNDNKKSDFTHSNGYWFLCSDPENGLHVNTEPQVSPLVSTTPERVGVLLDFDKSELSFYSVTNDGRGVHLFTMMSNFQQYKEGIVPLFNPGIGDKAPLKIINPGVTTQNEPGGSASVYASDADRNV